MYSTWIPMTVHKSRPFVRLTIIQMNIRPLSFGNSSHKYRVSEIVERTPQRNFPSNEALSNHCEYRSITRFCLMFFFEFSLFLSLSFNLNQLPWHNGRVISETAHEKKLHADFLSSSNFPSIECPAWASIEMQTMKLSGSLFKRFVISPWLVGCLSLSRKCAISLRTVRSKDVTYNRRNKESTIILRSERETRIMCYAHSLDFKVSIGSLVRFFWPTYQSKCVLFMLVADANK